MAARWDTSPVGRKMFRVVVFVAVVVSAAASRLGSDSGHSDSPERESDKRSVFYITFYSTCCTHVANL